MGVILAQDLLSNIFRRGPFCSGAPMDVNQPLIEPLEQRALLAANPNYIISFYGLGGAGGFGTDWLDKTVDDAGAATGAVVRKYDEDQGGRALKDFLRSADRNRNNRIDKAEV